jgi:sulfite exporter TauE/SafE
VIAGVAAVTLVVLGFGIMIGLVKPGSVGRVILRLVLGPILIGAGITLWRDLFAALPPVQGVAFVVLTGIAMIVAGLRIVLPRRIWEGVAAAFIYDAMRSLVLLPFRAVARLLRSRG